MCIGGVCRRLRAMTEVPAGGYWQSPGPPTKLRPSRVWYIVAGVVVLLAWAGAGTLIAIAAANFPNPASTIRPSGELQRVQLDEPGLTVYIDRTGVTGRCKALDQAGKPLGLEAINGNESVTVDGKQWYVLLRTGQSVEPGTYLVACLSKGADAHFAVGGHKSVTSAILQIFGGIGLVAFGLVAGFVIWLITFLRRRSARRRAQPAGPYGPYPPPYPGSPPPGSYPPRPPY